MVLPMARDLGKFGIRVVSIAPALFITPMTDFIPNKSQERYAKESPLNRLGQPTEFADFACTVIENGYINGVCLRLDGGQKGVNL